MQISNRIILTDVDGVLLEWENHFTQWMLQRSYYEKEVGEGYVGKKAGTCIISRSIQVQDDRFDCPRSQRQRPRQG